VTTTVHPAPTAGAAPGAPTAGALATVPPAAVLPTSPAALAALTAAATGRPTPTRMRVLAGMLVALGVLVSGVAGWSYMAADVALGRADENAAQLVRLQELQTRLVRADADATNAFLVGGLEPVDQRADYDDALTDATTLVTQAARAQPADGTVLGDLNTAILSYANDVERARAANRQGLPVGSQYLRNASAELRADALPALAALIDANQARMEAELRNARTAWILVVLGGAAGTAAVVAASVWLARRTHRYVNPRLAGAGVVLVILTVASAVVLGSVAAQVGDVSSTHYAAASALSQARLGAYDAKANESLTLIARGNGAAFEAAFTTSSERTTTGLADAAATGTVPADLAGDWGAYTDLHTQIRALDDGGSWDDAVAAATARGAGSANEAFATFDRSSGAALTAASAATSDGLTAADRGLQLGMWVGLGAGLLVAFLSWSGIARRIEEYR
jgi:hypothetical protein